MGVGEVAWGWYSDWTGPQVPEEFGLGLTVKVSEKDNEKINVSFEEENQPTVKEMD